MAGTTLGVASHRGTHGRALRARVRVPTCRRRRGGRIGAHVHPRCVPSFRHVSHSRGIHTDICPTRGCKWARPIYDRQSRNSAQTIDRLSSWYDTISRSRASHSRRFSTRDKCGVVSSGRINPDPLQKTFLWVSLLYKLHWNRILLQYFSFIGNIVLSNFCTSRKCEKIDYKIFAA